MQQYKKYISKQILADIAYWVCHCKKAFISINLKKHLQSAYVKPTSYSIYM